MTLIGYEAKKLACHREIFLILIGLFVVAQVLFARSSLMIQSAVTKQYSQELVEGVSEDNTDLGLSYQVEQMTHYREYLDGYPDYIQTVLSQADQMEKVAVFQKQGSYAISNIQKTKSDFAKLDQVTLSDNAPLWIRNVLCWNNGIAILLMQVLVIVTVLFGAEQKNGIGKLWVAQYRGRKPVMAAKWSCLLVISFLLVVLSYVGFLIQARLQCKAGDLFAPIQSFEEFKRCSWKVNCLQMLIWNLIENWMIVFFIGSLFALLLSKIGVGFASVVLVALLSVSWVLNKKLPETSFGLFFKEVNLYSFLYAEKRLRLYQNVNLFGRAIQNETCFIVSMLIGHPVIGLCLRHAAGQERKEYRLGEKIGKWKLVAHVRQTTENWKSEHASIVWHELYEVFGYQWRWFILVVFLIVGWYAIGQGDDGYYFLKKATYNSYMQTLQGAYTPEKEAFLQQEKAFLEGTDSTMEHLAAQLLDGSITQEEYEQEQIKIEREIDQKIDGFRIVEQQWHFIEEQKANGANHVGFFNQYLAEKLFDKNPASLTAAVFLVLFAIVFLLGYQQIEYPCTGLIRVNFHGRGKQIRTKLVINIVIMVAMELFVSYRYYSGILSNYPACDFSINTSCIELLSQTVGNMSVGTFLFLKFILGVIGAICLAVLISGIALLPQRPVVQYCLASVLLGLPILFLKMGLPFATGGMAVFLCTDYLNVQLLPVGLVIWICYGAASFLFFFRTYQTAVRTKRK